MMSHAENYIVANGLKHIAPSRRRDMAVCDMDGGKWERLFTSE